MSRVKFALLCRDCGVEMFEAGLLGHSRDVTRSARSAGRRPHAGGGVCSRCVKNDVHVVVGRPVPASQQPRRSANTLSVSGGQSSGGDLLAETLRIAVPMWIEKAATWDCGRERLAVLQRWADDAVHPLMGYGDSILFAGSGGVGDEVRNPDGSALSGADVFNHLARGIAALSHQPGGVRAFGLVWCVAHSPAGVESAAPCCEQCAAPTIPSTEKEFDH